MCYGQHGSCPSLGGVTLSRYRQNLETWVEWAACRVPSLGGHPSLPDPRAPQMGGLWARLQTTRRHTLYGLALETVGPSYLPMPLLAASLPERESSRELVSGTDMLTATSSLTSSPMLLLIVLQICNLALSLGGQCPSQEAGTGWLWSCVPRAHSPGLALHPCANVRSRWAWAGASVPGERSPQAQWQPWTSLGPTHSGWPHSGCTCSGHVCERDCPSGRSSWPCGLFMT